MIGNIYIPIDISKQIFNYLEYKDIINFSLVSQGGLNLVNTYRGTPEFYIRSLNGVQCHFESVEKIIEFVTEKQNFNQIKIENLDLSYFRSNINNKSFGEIVNNVRLVGILNVQNVTFRTMCFLTEKLENLKKLTWKVSNNSGAICTPGQKILLTSDARTKPLTLLEDLTITGQVETIVRSKFFQQLPSLKKITIKGSFQSDKLIHFVALEIIHIQYHPELTNLNVETLLQKPTLKHLILEKCAQVTDQCFATAINYPDIELQIL